MITGPKGERETAGQTGAPCWKCMSLHHTSPGIHSKSVTPAVHVVNTPKEIPPPLFWRDASQSSQALTDCFNKCVKFNVLFYLYERLCLCLIYMSGVLMLT